MNKKIFVLMILILIVVSACKINKQSIDLNKIIDMNKIIENMKDLKNFEMIITKDIEDEKNSKTVTSIMNYDLNDDQNGRILKSNPNNIEVLYEIMNQKTTAYIKNGPTWVEEKNSVINEIVHHDLYRYLEYVNKDKLIEIDKNQYKIPFDDPELFKKIFYYSDLFEELRVTDDNMKEFFKDTYAYVTIDENKNIITKMSIDFSKVYNEAIRKLINSGILKDHSIPVPNKFILTIEISHINLVSVTVNPTPLYDLYLLNNTAKYMSELTNYELITTVELTRRGQVYFGITDLYYDHNKFKVLSSIYRDGEEPRWYEIYLELNQTNVTYYKKPYGLWERENNSSDGEYILKNIFLKNKDYGFLNSDLLEYQKIAETPNTITYQVPFKDIDLFKEEIHFIGLYVIKLNLTNEAYENHLKDVTYIVTIQMNNERIEKIEIDFTQAFQALKTDLINSNAPNFMLELIPETYKKTTEIKMINKVSVNLPNEIKFPE